MGFLTSNRSRRQLLSHRIQRPLKRQRLDDLPRSPTPKLTAARLEDLPIEILEIIFVQSANFSLPQSSKVLASKLRRNGLLEEYLLLGQLDEETGELPIQTSTWPFVTADLLDRMRITGFSSIHIPKILEEVGTPQSLDLIIYMVRMGCTPNDPDILYHQLLNLGRTQDVYTLISKDVACDQSVVIEAMRLNYTELAQALVEMVAAKSATIADTEDIWTYASQTHNTQIIERLLDIKNTQSNSGT